MCPRPLCAAQWAGPEPKSTTEHPQHSSRGACRAVQCRSSPGQLRACRVWCLEQGRGPAGLLVCVAIGASILGTGTLGRGTGFWVPSQSLGGLPHHVALGGERSCCPGKRRVSLCPCWELALAPGSGEAGAAEDGALGSCAGGLPFSPHQGPCHAGLPPPRAHEPLDLSGATLQRPSC